MVEWCGGGMMVEWCGGGMMVEWCGGGMMVEWCGGGMMWWIGGVHKNFRTATLSWQTIWI